MDPYEKCNISIPLRSYTALHIKSIHYFSACILSFAIEFLGIQMSFPGNDKCGDDWLHWRYIKMIGKEFQRFWFVNLISWITKWTNLLPLTFTELFLQTWGYLGQFWKVAIWRMVWALFRVCSKRILLSDPFLDEEKPFVQGRKTRWDQPINKKF